MSERHWVWVNEPTADDEAMIYGVPPVIAAQGLLFNQGHLVTQPVPLIEIERDADSQGRLTDNLIAAGVKGLLFSTRLCTLLHALGIDNLQHFPVLVRNPLDGTETHDYALINVVGRITCLDRAKSVLKHPPTDPQHIEFIETLALDAGSIHGQDFFRLGEVPEILIASSRVKEACETARITGVRFYAPEDYMF